MENNDILRRLRYVLDFNDTKMVQVFELSGHKLERLKLSGWLKKDDDQLFQEMSDRDLAIFLNGLIIEKRGRRDGPQPIPEDQLNYNVILLKIKIAFNLKTDDIIKLFELIEKRISEHELSSFFRNPKHPKYRLCNGQYFRNFLDGLQKKFRT